VQLLPDLTGRRKVYFYNTNRKPLYEEKLLSAGKKSQTILSKEREKSNVAAIQQYVEWKILGNLKTVKITTD
jgi:hypothetical protein